MNLRSKQKTRPGIEASARPFYFADTIPPGDIEELELVPLVDGG